MQRLNYRRAKENILLVIFIIAYLILFSLFEFFGSDVGRFLSKISDGDYQSIAQVMDEESSDESEEDFKAIDANLSNVLNGVNSQLEVLLCVYMVLTLHKKGLITGSILSICNAVYVSVKVIRHEEFVSAPGIITPLCTLLTINILYRYVYTTQMLLSLDMNTEVYNRNQYLKDLTFFTGKKMRAVGCAFVDVNGLHDHNNNFGHESGDRLLRSVADMLRETFPKASIYRIGGDEFTIIYPNCKKKELSEGLDEAKRKLNENEIYIAVGMEWRRHNIVIDDMLKAADGMMYIDKNNFYKLHPEFNQRHSNDAKSENSVAASGDEN